MLTWFRKWLDDDTFFERFVRGVLGGVGTYLGAKGIIDPALAATLVGLGLTVGAGDKNPPASPTTVVPPTSATPK